MTKLCQNCKQNFEIFPEDQAFYEKVKVPAPTFCPACRFERRVAYRNERKLFWNTSAKSGKKTISLYSKQSGITVYDEDEWREDDWDAMTLGAEYDFNKNFFVQFHELALKVPHVSRSCEGNIGSDYVANCGHSKDCYLIFNSNESENCSYGNAVDFSKDCFNNSHLKKCERCYESLWLHNCYAANFSVQCTDCRNVWFCKDCKNCSDCFGSVNLRNCQYFIFNKPHEKEEYQKIVSSFALDTYSGLEQEKMKSYECWLSHPVRYMQGVNNLNVTGEYVTHSKNVHEGYLIYEGENLRYSQYLLLPPSSKDCMDISIWGSGNELCYENSICGFGVFNSKFCVECWPDIENLEYCMFCRSCSDCFGCVGIKKKQYCIFNNQYTKEEYETLREKIIQHMNEIPYIDKGGRKYMYGEFFPIEHAPFGYNTSVASEHFECNKDEVLRNGYPWDESESQKHEIDIDVADLPNSVCAVGQEILGKKIGCAKCERAFQITKPEFDFLKESGIPLPRKCAECKQLERLKMRNGFRLWQRRCDCGSKSSASHGHDGMQCPNEFRSSYSPERPEIVYCEQCYQSEVV